MNELSSLSSMHNDVLKLVTVAVCIVLFFVMHWAQHKWEIRRRIKRAATAKTGTMVLIDVNKSYEFARVVSVDLQTKTMKVAFVGMVAPIGTFNFKYVVDVQHPKNDWRADYGQQNATKQ